MRLHEKGGKEHTMPCHHNLEEYLTAYIDGCGYETTPMGRCSAQSAGYQALTRTAPPG